MTSNKHLRLGVLAMNGGHVVMSLIRGHKKLLGLTLAYIRIKLYLCSQKKHTFMYDIKVLKKEEKDGILVIYAATCEAVCSQQIAVAVKDNIILEAQFVGGCSGNTQGVAALVKGMKVEEAISRLEGIHCGSKPTSCPDQLAKVLKCVNNNASTSTKH